MCTVNAMVAMYAMQIAACTHALLVTPWAETFEGAIGVENAQFGAR
mgnify:CR=1 FL=1